MKRIAAMMIFGMAAAGLARAESNLLEKSPFLPPTSGPSRAATETPSSFEFRGFFSVGDETYFSLFDTSRNRGVWLGLRDSHEGVEVLSFDPMGEMVEISHEGASLSLRLKEGRVASTPTEPSATGGSQPGAGSAPASPPRVEATSGLSDERRQQIADEIRRRRAMRRAAPSGRR